MKKAGRPKGSKSKKNEELLKAFLAKQGKDVHTKSAN